MLDLNNISWKDRKDIITYSIPYNDSFKLENDYFYGCTNLKNIEIPTTLKNIGVYAFKSCVNLPKQNVGLEILKLAKKRYKQYYGLCLCLDDISRELILKYRQPINVYVELPMFTKENAIKYVNGIDNSYYWFKKDDINREKFIDWMIKQIKKDGSNNK